MTYQVFQHWDPLRVCVVGRCYPPEIFTWIKDVKIRNLFERIAIETEEDLQKIIDKLNEFNVTVHRPVISEDILIEGQYQKPPITPRDHMVMIGKTFYEFWSTNFSKVFYDDIKDSSWPNCENWQQFNELPAVIQQECRTVFGFPHQKKDRLEYDGIFQLLKNQGNRVCSGRLWVNGAGVARIGKDLFFGTDAYDQDIEKMQKIIDAEFPLHRNHIVNTGGHSDSTYCPVCPGLIISTYDISSYQKTFPDWEIRYIEPANLRQQKDFSYLANINNGKWWIPGFEYDKVLTNFVESYLTHWIGNVVETVFDVNMLIIDPKNVLVFNENKILFQTLHRYGITPHVVNFRHRFFWDGGIHCLTLDLDREGEMKDFFPANI